MYGNASDGSRASLAVIGRYLVLYALAATLIWVGGLKFAAYEAEAIAPLVMESPLLSWVYDILDVPTFARVLGTAEILAGIGIALRPLAPMLAAVGAGFATLLFLVTVTFLVTTPGVYEAAGFPQLSVMPGQFLAKDLTFLAVSIWVLGDSLAAMGRGTRMPDRMAAA